MNHDDRYEQIVLDDPDRQRFLETLGQVCHETGWQAHACCPNGIGKSKDDTALTIGDADDMAEDRAAKGDGHSRTAATATRAVGSNCRG